METKKPSSIAEYKEWLEAEHRLVVDSKLQTYYQTVCDRMKEGFEHSLLWDAFSSSWNPTDQEFLTNTNYYLFVNNEPPILEEKPFDSFVLKTFRRNVLNNEKWPDPPDQGWMLPPTWYHTVKDIIRTLVVVKYFDGVKFVAEKLERIARENGINYELSWEAREEGYYAAHFVFISPVEIPSQNWDTEMINAHMEIQITTQVQDVIRNLLHKYYENNRGISEPEPTHSWRWDYKKDEFMCSYLGHILHYVEGMIVEIRDKQKRGHP